MSNGSGPQAQVQPPQQQAPKPPGRMRRAIDWVANKVRAKPEVLANGYEADKASKGLESFVTRTRIALERMNDRQKISTMLEVYRVLNPSEGHAKLPDEVKKPLFELMAKLYGKGNTAQLLEQSTNRTEVAMRRFMFQLAEDMVKAEGKSRTALDAVRVLGRTAYDMNDAIRTASILVHSYQVPFDQGVERLARDLGAKYSDFQKIGFLLEAQNRGLFVSIAESDYRQAQRIFKNLLQRASPASGATERAIRDSLMKLVMEATKRGEHATFQEALSSVLRSKEFEADFLKMFAKGPAGEVRDTHIAALKAALASVIAGMDDAAKKGLPSLAGQMGWVLSKRNMAERTGYYFKNKEILDPVMSELQALNKYVNTVSLSKPVNNSFQKYSLLAKQASLEAEKLGELAEHELRGVRPIISHRLPKTFPWKGVARYASPILPATVAREIGESLGMPAGLRWKAFREVKAGRRLAVYTAVYVGGIYLVNYGFKKRRESLEKALQERGTELTKHLSRLSRDDLKFFRDNADAFYLFRALLVGAPVGAPKFESDLYKYFREPAGPVTNPKKIGEFAEAYRQMWFECATAAYYIKNNKVFEGNLAAIKEKFDAAPDERARAAARKDLITSYGRIIVEEAEKNGFDVRATREAVRNRSDPMVEIAYRLDGWMEPARAYMRPSTETKGGHMIGQFGEYYGLDPRLQKFLSDYPEIFQMLYIGLAEGSVAASNLPGLLWKLREAESSSPYEARRLLAERQKSGETGPILPALSQLVGSGWNKYLYAETVASDSVLRSAEIYGIAHPAERKRLDELLYLFNATPDAARIRAVLDKVRVPKGMVIIGNPVDLALKIAKEEITSLAEAQKRGFIAQEMYAKAGITNPQTVEFIQNRGLVKWFEKSEPKMFRAQPIFDLIGRQNSGGLLKNFDAARLEKHIEDQAPQFEGRYWWGKGRAPKRGLPVLGGGVVPVAPLEIVPGKPAKKTEAAEARPLEAAAPQKIQDAVRNALVLPPKGGKKSLLEAAAVIKVVEEVYGKNTGMAERELAQMISLMAQRNDEKDQEELKLLGVKRSKTGEAVVPASSAREFGRFRRRILEYFSKGELVNFHNKAGRWAEPQAEKAE